MFAPARSIHGSVAAAATAIPIVTAWTMTGARRQGFTVNFS